MITLHTIGKGQSPSNDPKVEPRISGHIQSQVALGATAHRIPVSPGTKTDVAYGGLRGLFLLLGHLETVLGASAP